MSARRNNSMIVSGVLRPASNTGTEGVITIPSDTKVQMAGNILQIKQTVFPGQFAHDTGRYYQEVEGLRANLTPKFANSSVLVCAHMHVGSEYWYITSLIGRDTPGQSIGTSIEEPNRYGIQSNGSKFFRDQTDTAVPQSFSETGGQKSLYRQYGAPYGFGDQVSNRLGATMAYNKYVATSGANADYHMATESITFMDYPNTTEECRYKVYLRGYDDSFQVYVNRTHGFQNQAAYDALPISSITLMEIGGNTNPTQFHAAYIYETLGD